MPSLYDLVVDIADIGLALSILSTPLLLVKRYRSSRIGIIPYVTAQLCFLQAYWNGWRLYLNWNHGWNIFAVIFTAGIWPLFYSAIACFYHPGHDFFIAVVSEALLAWFLMWLSRGFDSKTRREREQIANPNVAKQIDLPVGAVRPKKVISVPRHIAETHTFVSRDPEQEYELHITDEEKKP